MPSTLMIVAGMFVLLSIVFFIVSVVALQMRRFLGMAASFILVLLMLSVSGLCYVVTIATKGYRVLTHEELAVVVTTEPTGRQQFTARLQFPDGRDTTLDLAGDQLYVDARILKWKPLANIFGLHTAYELDRVGGRYEDIEDERQKDRTVFALPRPERRLDMFDLRRQYALLTPFLDADYGSASFVTTRQASEYQVLVSTTGLMIRDTQDISQ